MSLIPQKSLVELGNVMTHGAGKYGPHNWRAGMDWSRLLSAAMRHMAQWNEGESIDEESGLNHLAHAAANLLMLLEYEIKSLGKDDRYGSSKE